MRQGPAKLRLVLVPALVLLIASAAGTEELVDRSLPEYSGIPAPELQPWTGMGPVESQKGLIDDFNRPDGPLGADWTVQAGSFQILNQAARGGTIALATHNTATGDTVEMDVATDGTTTGQFAAAVLNYGGGSSNLFIKVQDNGGVTQFNRGGCYTGNNNGGGSFGLGFYTLTTPFSTAHMRVNVDASRTVTIDFTNIDGGALPDQQYVCAGAPAAEGPAIGIGAWQNRASMDNFADGPIPVELQGFTIE